ncbi:MAG: fatty acid desaturase [Proteobacteria bacterium]|nr:fatty acid desaturase [Pseudomonadota bacterium]
MPNDKPLVRDPNDPDSAYWFIHGKRYDLREYMDKHPAGRLPLELTQGRDSTELYESYHSLCKRPKKMLKRFEVTDAPSGCPHHKSPFNWDETPFYDDLKSRVIAHFKAQGRHAHKTPWQGWMLHATWTTLAVLSFAAWALGHWWALITLPLFYWLGPSNMMHTGNHFALSTKPWVNQLGGLIGAAHIAPATWHRQHNIGHHAYTNINGLDPDLNHFQHTEVPMPGFRLSPDQPWMGKYVWHRWAMAAQAMMTTMGPSLLNTPEYLIDGTMAKTVPYLFRSRTEVLTHVVGRLAVVGVCFVLPFFLFSPAKAAVFAFVPLALHGLLYFAFSQVSHVNARCVPSNAEPIEWAVHQVGTCQDYSMKSRLWNQLSIGLNNQVVHHLFPQVAPWHYPALAEIIEQTCRDHGVDYGTSRNWLHAFQQLLDHVAGLNDAPEATP